MRDVQDLLERKARRYPGGGDDAWDRVMDRLGARARKRRFTAGALALVIAASGAFGALRLLGDGRGEPAAGGDAFIAALWPEQTATDARAAQERVDAGEDRWRLDPLETATRFVTEILGWMDVMGEALTIEDPDVRLAVLSGSGREDLFLQLRRLVRDEDGGIWSVTKVYSERLVLDLEPGDEVSVPSSVMARTTLPESAPNLVVMYDWRYQGCEYGVVSETNATPVGNEISIELALTHMECHASGASTSSDRGPLQRPAHGFVAVLQGELAPEDISLSPSTPSSGPILDAAIVPVTFLPEEGAESSPEPVESPSVDASEGFAVWPEDTYEEAAQVQRAADDGDPGAQWRLDPDQVVRRFVTEVMGRRVVDVGYEPGHGGDGTAFVRDELGTEHTLGLNQRVRPDPVGIGAQGGIWSITSARTEGTEVVTLSIGYDHDRIGGTAPPGTEVEISIAYGSDEGEPTFGFTTTVDANGGFGENLRSHYGGQLPVPTESGHLIVRVLAPEGGYSAIRAMSLPARGFAAG